MRRPSRRRGVLAALPLSLSLLVVAAPAASAPAEPVASPSMAAVAERPGDEPLVRAFRALDRSVEWELVDRVALDFPTYHPQGFAFVGDLVFMSSVEVIKQPVIWPERRNGYDRSPGKGVGHVLVLTRDGELLRDIELGRRHMYHPGGIDFDGRRVWVPVAQYRPDSKALVYSIDPRTYDVRREFGYDDHVGGIVRDYETGRLHGVSWGSRTQFTWTIGGRLLEATANPNHLVDYQDCAYVDRGQQICSGVTELPDAAGGTYELGGLSLLDLSSDEILHELPFPYFSDAGHVATRNPVQLELDDGSLRLLAAPDDGEEVAGTELLVYEPAPED